MLNIGILVSGRGSNMESIISACQDKTIPGRVVAVVSDNPNAAAIEKAKARKIDTTVIQRRDFPNTKSFEKEIVKYMNERNVDLICLAGFMRIIGPTLLNAFKNKIMNIHPSLLPSFPGLDAQKQAFDYGVRFIGCTVHFVDDKMDHGPIILQSSVAVEPEDTAETLSARILKQEHRLYPEAVRLFAQGRLHIEGRRVYIVAHKGQKGG